MYNNSMQIYEELYTESNKKLDLIDQKYMYTMLFHEKTKKKI